MEKGVTGPVHNQLFSFTDVGGYADSSPQSCPPLSAMSPYILQRRTSEDGANLSWT